MEVIVAQPCGFCYGVKRAVQMAEEAAANHVQGGTYGPLIHNPQFIEALSQKGIPCKDNLEDFHKGETVIFRSHGVGPEGYQKADTLQLNILDATCPNVKMAQQKAHQAALDGYLPIIIGEKNHPEVKSILAWAGETGIVVEYNKDILSVPKREKYAVIIQTTFELKRFEELLAELKATHPGEYRVERTICLATSQRQEAAVRLAKLVDAFVVIGGRNSANTRHLLDLVQKFCPKCYQIETASELKPQDFLGCHKIGITAGASTPDRLIKEAVRVMEDIKEKSEFEKMLDASMEDVNVFPGKLVKGKVIMKDKEGAYVNFGYMREGMVNWKDWTASDDTEATAASVNIGDEVEAVVIPGAAKEEFIRLSKIRAEKEAAWKDVQPLAEGEKRPCTVKVLRVIKSRGKDREAPKRVVGLGVAVEGVEGFMPASHVELRHIEDFTPYVGQELQAEIIEVDLDKKRIVVSRRDLLKAEKETKHQEWLAGRDARIAAAKEARAAKEEAAYASVAEGEVYEGKVVKVADFGLFVEIGDGLVGLVHNSELSYERGKKAADVAKEGDTVKVFVKKIDKENHRVSLSIKATQEDPWVKAAAGFAEGQIVEGTIDRFLPFGALVKLNDTVEGMIHVSEISTERVEKPEDVLKLGDTVKVKVIRVDTEHRKIGLSLKQVKEDAVNAEIKPFVTEEKPALANTEIKDQLESLKK
jgi:small subunit ribosomal protein S1